MSDPLHVPRKESQVHI